MAGYVLGLNPGFGGFNYHDPSACLLGDGEIVALAEEERYTRVKSAPGVFPSKAVRACLDYAGISVNDLDAVAIGYSPDAWQLDSRSRPHRPRVRCPVGKPSGAASRTRRATLVRAQEAIADAALRFADIAARGFLFRDAARCEERIQTELETERVPVRCVEHHPAHAASAFYSSGFDTATVLVVDGLGEIETLSAWRAEGDRIERVLTDQLPNSIGYTYAAMTEFLGFKGFEGEGKTMALAPYGGPDPRFLRPLADLITVDANCFDASRFVMPLLGSALMLDLRRANATLSEMFGIPPRPAGAPLTDAHKAIAWAAQDILERFISALARHAVGRTGLNNLCFAGGVALNCKLNLVLREQLEAGRLFVQPVASDAGVGLGSAQVVAAERGASVRRPLRDLRLGPTTQPRNTDTDLASWGWAVEQPRDLAIRTARAIADGKIVMWYWGRSEVGPRALGARSILGDPRSLDVRDRITEEVKRREPWRPYAPSILLDYAPEVLEQFTTGDEAPFMIQAYRMKPEWRTRVPAVIHPADGTTRPHTVDPTLQPDYAAVIEAFRQITGVPLVLNTSLNDRGDPIVETPMQAVRHFATSAADVLVIDGRWIAKAQCPPNSSNPS